MVCPVYHSNPPKYTYPKYNTKSNSNSILQVVKEIISETQKKHPYFDMDKFRKIMIHEIVIECKKAKKRGVPIKHWGRVIGRTANIIYGLHGIFQPSSLIIDLINERYESPVFNCRHINLKKRGFYNE